MRPNINICIKRQKTTWSNFDFSTLFKIMSKRPFLHTVEIAFPQIESLDILMYDRTSSWMIINEARKDLFTQNGRSFKSIPLKKDALLHQFRRTVYQACYVWCTFFLRILRSVLCCLRAQSR